MPSPKTSRAEPSHVITLNGIIVPAKWDDGGNPVVLVLSTDQEEEYVLNISAKKEEKLRKLLQQSVRISGTVDSGNDRQKRLTVTRFKKRPTNGHAGDV